METPKHKPHVNIGAIKSDNTETLANALQQIEKLEADKAELLEALYKARIALNKWDDELSYDIYDIIQKHKATPKI